MVKSKLLSIVELLKNNTESEFVFSFLLFISKFSIWSSSSINSDSVSSGLILLELLLPLLSTKSEWIESLRDLLPIHFLANLGNFGAFCKTFFNNKANFPFFFDLFFFNKIILKKNEKNNKYLVFVLQDFQIHLHLNLLQENHFDLVN